MNDKGEKTCPLCTEEMDLTDQQLKPCECGYEICVWCWHRIMDVAEKDNTEGRCPACRAPYDKEKIVGMAEKCERLVAEINSERKQKLPKAKSKAPEAKKHFNDIRVIQRNLVYVMGIPLNYSNEALLQRKEYFGQYGKVLKVSVSRTSNGVIQQFANDSCSVYIKYSKEEEAIRCIQSVHSFVLQGRSLRACFGTTKYCHAWLRNLPCNNADCLYLHDVGSQEDSFTKDEIVSAFARSRVQQVIGAINNSQRHSGNMLPPPVDQHSAVNASSALKPTTKFSSNNTGSQLRGLCPDNNNGSSTLLPAGVSWVMHVSNDRPVSTLSASSAPPKQEPDTFLPAEVVSTKRSSFDTGDGFALGANWPEVHPNSNFDLMELTKQFRNGNFREAAANSSADIAPDGTPVISMSSNHISCPPAFMDCDVAASPDFMNSVELTKEFCSPGSYKDGNIDVNGNFQGLCSDLLPISVNSDVKHDYSVPVPNISNSSHFSFKCSGNQWLPVDKFREHSTPLTFMEATPAVHAICAPEDNDLQAFDNQSVNGSECTHHSQSLSCSSDLPQILNQPSSYSWQKDVENKKNLRRLSNQPANARYNCALDMGESSIISNILSLDLDAWDDSLVSLHGLTKLLSDTDKNHGHFKFPSLQKNSSQSRFSFARQDECSNHLLPTEYCAPQDFMTNRDHYLDKHQNIFLSDDFVDSDDISCGHSFILSSKHPVSGKHSATPPGYSVPHKAPPPGFSSHERVEQALNSSSANCLLPKSFLPGDHFQAPAARNAGSTKYADYIDSAIVDVDNGMLGEGTTNGLNNIGLDGRSISSPRPSPFECESKPQLPMPQIFSAHQNQGLSNYAGNRFSPSIDSYNIPSTLLGQSRAKDPSSLAQLTSQQFRNAHLSNGHQSSWNEVKTISDWGMSEFLVNDRLGSAYPGLRT